MSATRPKLNLLYILENVAAVGGGGCASQTWAPHFELSFRVTESGRNQAGQGQNLKTDIHYSVIAKKLVYIPKRHYLKHVV